MKTSNFSSISVSEGENEAELILQEIEVNNFTKLMHITQTTDLRNTTIPSRMNSKETWLPLMVKFLKIKLKKFWKNQKKLKDMITSNRKQEG